YIVARENLGTLPGLIAAGALLTDYVLTVAVSISAGIAAIVSAFPQLAPERILLCILAIALITVVNLRGAKESGKLFAPPVYLFVAGVVIMIVLGLYRALVAGDAAPQQPIETLPAVQPFTFFLLIRAFASGCAALTGIEAISDGVAAFTPPESKNAATTLAWMGTICIVLFLGITILARIYHVVPDPHSHETVVSMLGRRIFGGGVFYFILQTLTCGILILAANTSFADFPRLSSILARDGFAPRQLANLGDRLVFSNGILLLGLFSSLLVIAFGGLTHSLIPLYAVGVFVSFTLSQAGMVRRWMRLKGDHWCIKAIINAIGAATTGIVLLVVLSAKFIHGAWIITLVVPIIVLGFRKVNQHYRTLAASLRLEHVAPPRTMRHHVLILVPSVHKGVIRALRYAKSIAPDSEAVFVELDPKDTPRIREEWAALNSGIPLTILKSPWRSLAEPIIRYTRTLRAEHRLDTVTVIIPEFVTTRWWHRLLHNQSGLLLKLALMFEPGIIVTNVRDHTAELDNCPPSRSLNHGLPAYARRLRRIRGRAAVARHGLSHRPPEQGPSHHPDRSGDPALGGTPHPCSRRQSGRRRARERGGEPRQRPRHPSCHQHPLRPCHRSRRRRRVPHPRRRVRRSVHPGSRALAFRTDMAQRGPHAPPPDRLRSHALPQRQDPDSVVVAA
ncbi:MAG: APC family permease, partial [Armatimonadetes bacterium]|nr:APC family permease [Armatimonadota bacterium]